MRAFSILSVSQRSRLQSLTLLALLIITLGKLAFAVTPSNPLNLPPDVVRANQEIDEKFLEAHVHPNVDLIMSLFTKSPEVFFVGPTGIIFHGQDQVRKSIETFLSQVITMPGTIDRVTYLPSGDGGVIAYGQVTYHRQLKGRPADTKVVVWTDYRRKEDGKWVLVFRHAHWPSSSTSLAGSAQEH